MSEIVDPDEATPPSTDLSHPVRSARDSEVLLRNRDVQALSRSFRRMSEVQEALLEHLDQIEESRGRRWVLPFMAVACIVLGAGMATIGLLYFQQEREPIEVQFQQPEITVQPPEVTVQAPASEIDAALLQDLLTKMSEFDAQREEDRQRILELQGRLADGELALMDAMRELREMDRLQAEAASAAVQPAEAAATETGEPELTEEELEAQRRAEAEAAAERARLEEREAWLGALNGLIAADGHPEFRFQQGTRVEGEPKLERVLFLIWGEDGLVDSLVNAERAEFQLQQAAYSLEIRFFDGTRTRGQRKTALSGGGLSLLLPDVDVAAWLEHFPELAEGGPVLAELTPNAAAGESESAAAVESPTLQPAEIEALRASIDEQLSQRRASGFYRLNRLQGVNSEGLLGVQLAWHNARGELFRYIEADQLHFYTRGDGWLELRFRNGSFRSQGKKTPFQGGVYRLHLPDQDLAAWRAMGVPILPAQP